MNAEVSKIYKEHTIVVDNAQMIFKVKGSLIDGWFDSFRASTEAIDEASKRHKNQIRKRISLSALDEHGDPATITGVHAGNGSILGLKRPLGQVAPSFYPAVSWIGEALKKRGKLYLEIKSIDSSLKPYRLSQHSLRNHRSDGDLVDQLVSLIETATARAQEHETRLRSPEDTPLSTTSHRKG